MRNLLDAGKPPKRFTGNTTGYSGPGTVTIPTSKPERLKILQQEETSEALPQSCAIKRFSHPWAAYRIWSHNIVMELKTSWHLVIQ